MTDGRWKGWGMSKTTEQEQMVKKWKGTEGKLAILFLKDDDGELLISKHQRPWPNVQHDTDMAPVTITTNNTTDCGTQPFAPTHILHISLSAKPLFLHQTVSPAPLTLWLSLQALRCSRAGNSGTQWSWGQHTMSRLWFYQLSKKAAIVRTLSVVA